MKTIMTIGRVKTAGDDISKGTSVQLNQFQLIRTKSLSKDWDFLFGGACSKAGRETFAKFLRWVRFPPLPQQNLETMPFKSEKQRKYLYSQKPEVAKKFAKDSKPKGKSKKKQCNKSNYYKNK